MNINDLPNDWLAYSLSYFAIPRLMVLRSVCKHWYKVIISMLDKHKYKRPEDAMVNQDIYYLMKLPSNVLENYRKCALFYRFLLRGNYELGDSPYEVTEFWLVITMLFNRADRRNEILWIINDYTSAQWISTAIKYLSGRIPCNVDLDYAQLVKYLPTIRDINDKPIIGFYIAVSSRGTCDTTVDDSLCLNFPEFIRAYGDAMLYHLQKPFWK